MLYFLLAFATVGCIFLVAPKLRVPQPAPPMAISITAKPAPHRHKPDTIPPPKMHAEDEVLSFLDSVGRLPLPPLPQKKRELKLAPSVIRCHERIAHVQFQELNSGNQNGKISWALALALDSSGLDIYVDPSLPAPDSISASIFWIDKRSKRVAVELPQRFDRNSTIVFVENHRILERHSVHHRYGLELQFLPDSAGCQLVHYRHCEAASSGLGAEFQEHYFSWGPSGISPVLTIPHAIDKGMGQRTFSIESKPIQANPLLIQFNYQQVLWDPETRNSQYSNDVLLIEDSVVLRYNFDTHRSCYVADWSKSKLSYRQFLTYDFWAEEIPFIQAHYHILKKILNGNDIPRRRAVQFFLSEYMAFEYENGYY